MFQVRKKTGRDAGNIFAMKVLKKVIYISFRGWHAYSFTRERYSKNGVIDELRLRNWINIRDPLHDSVSFVKDTWRSVTFSKVAGWSPFHVSGPFLSPWKHQKTFRFYNLKTSENLSFLYPLKTPENQRPVTWNRLRPMFPWYKN